MSRVGLHFNLSTTEYLMVNKRILDPRIPGTTPSSKLREEIESIMMWSDFSHDTPPLSWFDNLDKQLRSVWQEGFGGKECEFKKTMLCDSKSKIDEQ